MKRGKLLVTEDSAKKIDLMWQNTTSINSWIRKLDGYGIREKDFEVRKERLFKKSGKVVNDRDIIWSLFNELITRTKDLYELKMIYYDMALFLNEEGKDFFSVLQQSAKMELMRYKKDGIEKVRILASGKSSCAACQSLDDKIYTLAEALEKMPIPCKDCATNLNNSQRGFCRCCYVAEVD